MTNVPQQQILPAAGVQTEFDEQDYLELYPDVAKLVRDGLLTAEEHWLHQGSKEGRQGRKSAVQLALEAESFHAQAEEAAALISQEPPAPPTLRASMSGALIRMLRPLFAWYTHGLREYVIRADARDRLVTRIVRSLAREAEDLRVQIRETEENAASARAELKRVIDADLAVVRSQGDVNANASVCEREIAERLRALESTQTELRNRLEAAAQNVGADSARLNVLRQDLAGLNAEIGRIRSVVAGVEQQMRTVAQDSLDAIQETRKQISEFSPRMNELASDAKRRIDELAAGTVEKLGSELTTHVEQQNKRLWELGGLIQAIREQVRANEARMSILLRELRRNAGNQDGGPEYLSLLPREFGTLYAAFEDAFRGSREEIKTRQRIYLSIFTEAGVGTSDLPVLDIGCGRGEWLELLRDQGMTARGVDANQEMLARSRAMGLDVAHGDAIGYLRSLPDNSQGAITTFHMVEHLPFYDVMTLIAESLRVLKPNGVFLFETPNPNNLLVGSRNFYTDPTHRHPLPCGLMKFVVEASGFSDVVVQEVNPMPDSLKLPDSSNPAMKFINDNFFGPQDYAVIGRKY